SELDSEEMNAIENLHKEMFPNDKCYKTEIKIENPVEIKAEAHKKAMSDLTKFRISISVFLSHIFEFENARSSSKPKENTQRLFDFSKEKNEVLLVIVGKDEEVAIKIERALHWLVDGTDPDIVCRTNEEIVVDFSQLSTSLSKNHREINFCFPPDPDSDGLDVLNRLRRVYGICTAPVVEKKMDKEGYFLAKYVSKKMPPKILILIKDMGWNAWLSNTGDLVICTHPDQNEEQSSEPGSSLVEVVPEPAVQEVHTSKYIATPGLTSKQPETVGSVFCTVQNRNEAFIELNKLYLNNSLFSNLPSEKQDMIKGVLKRIFQEEHTEEYADMLLSFLNVN
ncbi:MAG: hypothetical protein WCV79_04270, partial [Candidatus Paceibacterota bacterium]